LYGYLPSTFDASMSKPWEHVKMVRVHATASFLMPVIFAMTMSIDFLVLAALSLALLLPP